MQLERLQHQFLKSLHNGDDSRELLKLIDTDDEFPADERLALYRSTSLSAHIKALSESYPVCERILGKNYFRQMASLYISKHESRHPDLNRYGGDFATWIKLFSLTHIELDDFPYLSGLAKLEWYWQQAFYAEAVTAFNFTDFSEITEEKQTQIVFKLNPTVYLMESDYPVLEIWKVNRTEQTKVKKSDQEQKGSIYRYIDPTLTLKYKRLPKRNLIF